MLLFFSLTNVPERVTETLSEKRGGRCRDCAVILFCACTAQHEAFYQISKLGHRGEADRGFFFSVWIGSITKLAFSRCEVPKMQGTTVPKSSAKW